MRIWSLCQRMQVGETDVVIAYKQSLPFHLTLGLDDSGSKATGRLQGSATFSWDNVLTLNDMFYISGTRSFKRNSDDAEGDYGGKMSASIILFLGRTIS